jgi:cytidine deaminase
VKSGSIEIRYSVFSDIGELSPENRMLMGKAEEASLSAYAPYSKFRVGAAVLLGNGEIILGNNQENVSYPEGLCAERVALFAAMAQYPQEQIKAVAVYGNPMDCELNHFVTPCGACRQVLAECEQRSGNNISVLCGGDAAGEIFAVESVQDLLPFNFKM